MSFEKIKRTVYPKNSGMYKDYQEAIIRYYHHLKEENRLTPRLLIPTPSKLKNESRDVAMTRFENKDRVALATFFGPFNTQKELLHLIKNFDRELFIPLTKLMRGRTKQSDDKNYELLGWLLDFPHRPFDQKFDYENFRFDGAPKALPPPIATPYSAVTIEETVVEPPQTSGWLRLTSQKIKSSLRKKTVKVAGITALAVGSGFMFSSLPIGSGRNDCMEWTGTEYVSIPCYPQAGKGVLFEDERLIKEFKLITEPITITESDIGKVNYYGVNNNIQFFTTYGPHPVLPNKQTKPMTKYIYDKYIRPLKSK